MIKNGHGNVDKMKDKLTVIHLFLKRERECDFAIASDRSTSLNINLRPFLTVSERFELFWSSKGHKRWKTVKNIHANGQ